MFARSARWQVEEETLMSFARLGVGVKNLEHVGAGSLKEESPRARYDAAKNISSSVGLMKGRSE